MNKFWNQPIEVKALIISLVITVLGFMGTAFLFWFQSYDIPLAVLLSGTIVAVTWLCLYLSKRKGQKHIKLDLVLIFLRLILIVGFAILFTVLELTVHVATISPIALVVAYLFISLATLIAYFKKGENDV